VIRERELGIRATPAPVEKATKKTTKKSEKAAEPEATEESA
jgi:large subunit ribosomal protein L29